MDVRLDGKTALITGGSLGLGRAMGLAFAQAGAKVALVARRREVLAQARQEILAAAPGAKVGVFPCDVRQAPALQGTFAQAEKELGPVEILVNNAGTSRTGAFESLTDEVWQEDFDLKLFAAIRLARLAFPGMKARRWGRIINVLNTGAKAPPAGGAPTAVTRAAGMAMTKVLAGEGAPHNVLVNALLVGLIESDQWVQRQPKEAPHQSLEQYLKDKGKAVPLGRMGKAEEFANVACFLASDRASYITGTAINVDGGRSPVV
ncbi:MAG TPA: SDR family oxidoreductase [bacterium]|nr:SDR family oxidoreductase [bacterium]